MHLVVDLLFTPFDGTEFDRLLSIFEAACQVREQALSQEWRLHQHAYRVGGEGFVQSGPPGQTVQKRTMIHGGLEGLGL